MVVRSAEPSAVAEGDIITYREEGASAQGGTARVTHRVVSVSRENGTVRYRTKGDANEDIDPEPVAHDQVLGEVWFHLPAIGHVILFAQSSIGLVLLVVCPSLLLVGSELYRLYAGRNSEKSVTHD